MKSTGVLFKFFGLALMAGVPAFILLLAGHIYLTSPADRDSLISYAPIILTFVVVFGLVGLLILLLGCAFTGSKSEGRLGKPNS